MSAVNNVVTEANVRGTDTGYDLTVITSGGRFLVLFEVDDAAEGREVARKLSEGQAAKDWVQVIIVPCGTQVTRERSI